MYLMSHSRLGFLRTKSNLVIWSVKSWTLNFWSVIWKKLISGWFSWSCWTLISDELWSVDPWNKLIFDLLIFLDPRNWSFDLVDLWTVSLFKKKSPIKLVCVLFSTKSETSHFLSHFSRKDHPSNLFALLFQLKMRYNTF